MTTRAERLGVTQGVVWILGRSVEENALLDPLPDEVVTISERDDAADDDGDDDRDDDRHRHRGQRIVVDAAVVVVDDVATLDSDLDEALPQLGSIARVWIALPTHDRDLSTDGVSTAVADYGWSTVDTIDLDDDWTAMRIRQG